jgi:hypothetical protein
MKTRKLVGLFDPKVFVRYLERKCPNRSGLRSTGLAHVFTSNAFFETLDPNSAVSGLISNLLIGKWILRLEGDGMQTHYGFESQQISDPLFVSQLR